MKFEIILVLSLACITCVKSNSADEDCSLWLDMLSFSDFLEKSKDCRDETRTLFETKFIDFNFEVEGALIDNETEAIKENFMKKSITLKNVNAIKKVLNTFGDLIHNFKIDFEKIDEVSANEIVKHINNLKTLESFKMLSFQHCKGNVLDEWKNVFPNVTEFRFSSGSTEELKFKSDSQKLVGLLPKLKILELGNIRDSDWTFIGDKFPELSRFSGELPMLKDQNRSDDHHILGLLKNSKQIEDLDIGHTTLKLLKEANEILPGLKYLTIRFLSKYYGDDNIDLVEFKNVTNLRLNMDDEIPDKIFFNEIQKFDLNIQQNFTDKWFEFISKQIKTDAVNTFSLTPGSFSSMDLFNISNYLPHLKKFAILTESKFNADDIGFFIKSNKELEYLGIAIHMDEDEQNKFEKLIAKDWNIHSKEKDPTNKTVMKIERKKDTDKGDKDGPGTGSLATNSKLLLIFSLMIAFRKKFGASFQMEF